MIDTIRIFVIFCVLFLIFGQKLSAQSNQYGIGINIVDFFNEIDIYDSMEMTIVDKIKFPVLHGAIVLPNVRIDPEFSYWRYSHRVKNNLDKYSKEISGILHLGVGISPIIQKSLKYLTYAGIKTGVNILSSYSENSNASIEELETKITRTNIYLGPCLGSEYYFSEKISIGGEFQVLYTFIGDPKVTQNGETPDSDRVITDSIIKSNALLYLRWYF